MSYVTKSKVGNFVIEAKVIRADGSVEDLGVIARNNEKWFSKMLRRIKKWLM